MTATHTITVDERQIGAILAGLDLFYQADPDFRCQNPIATNDGAFEALNLAEINELCEVVNFGETAVFQSRHPILDRPSRFWVGDTDTFGVGSNPFAAWVRYLEAHGVDIDLSAVEMSVTQGNVSQTFRMGNVDDAFILPQYELDRAIGALYGALTWLVDDMSDAGEDRNEQGEHFDSVAHAVEVLKQYSACSEFKPYAGYKPPVPQRFILTAQEDDLLLHFEVVHIFQSDDPVDAMVRAVQAIRNGIAEWLETADIPEKESGGERGDNPCPMFTWSHYADYCQEINIPGIVSVTWLDNHYTVDLDEDFLVED